jgi:hypothetical protein
VVNGKDVAGVVLLLPMLGAQGGPARYTEARLGCATFRETVETEIRTTMGTSAREERAGRAGLLLIRAIAGDSGLDLLAWFDSLTVWREGPEGRSVPDTEGLLGGRWRGLLESRGRYTGRVVPFIPDEVAGVADLRGILEDFSLSSPTARSATAPPGAGQPGHRGTAPPSSRIPSRYRCIGNRSRQAAWCGARRPARFAGSGRSP